MFMVRIDAETGECIELFDLTPYLTDEKDDVLKFFTNIHQDMVLIWPKHLLFFSKHGACECRKIGDEMCILIFCI